MKKFVSAAAISFCVLGAVGSASAASFVPSTLTQVVYQYVDQTHFGTVEFGTNLGDITTLNLTAADLVVAPVGNIPSVLPAGLNWSNMRLGYFADDWNGFNFYYATTSKTAPGFSDALISSFDSAARAISGLYTRTPGTTQTTMVDPSQQINSYAYQMNQKTTAPGSYTGFNSQPTVGEASLSVLNSQDHVDMYLYQVGYDATNDVFTYVNGANTPYVATLRFNSNGSTVINPSAVPAPASMMLLGSGLVGLLGLRRKKN